MDLLRQYVGGPKNRYKDQKFNLDLTYISPRMIAMAFPASGIEKLYRNSVNSIKDFMTEHHGNNYLIINVSGREIDQSILPNVQTFDWQDHQAPPLQMLFNICNIISEFLISNQQNVIAVNCNHGKGRTGTIICCFLLFCNLFKNSQIAMDFYAKKRFQIDEGFGVTQPCQIQYIRYFQSILQNPNVRPRIVALTKVIFRGFTKYEILYVKTKNFQGQNIVTTKKSESNTIFEKVKGEDYINQLILTLSEEKYFFGDCKIVIKSPSTFGTLTVANYSFNTAFLDGNIHRIPLAELSPYSLKKSDMFDKQFYIQLEFKNLCPCPPNISYNDRCQKCKNIFTTEQEKWTRINEITEKRNSIEQQRRESMLGYHLSQKIKNLRLIFGEKVFPQEPTEPKGEQKKQKN